MIEIDLNSNEGLTYQVQYSIERDSEDEALDVYDILPQNIGKLLLRSICSDNKMLRKPRYLIGISQVYGGSRTPK